MAITNHIRGVNYRENGAISVTFDNSESIEWQDAQAMKDDVVLIDDPGNVDLSRRLLMRHWMAINPDMDNPSLILNKGGVLDLTAAAPLVFED